MFFDMPIHKNYLIFISINSYNYLDINILKITLPTKTFILFLGGRGETAFGGHVEPHFHSTGTFLVGLLFSVPDLNSSQGMFVYS